ncbi:MAG: zonular occludens toxin domain-containing protein [Dehalococcoidia bacterium]
MKLGPSLNNALIFLDEVHTLFDPQRSNTTAQYLLTHMLVQAGHRSMWLLYTTQDETMISRRLKYQTDLAVFVSSINAGKTVRFMAIHQGAIAPKGFKRTGTLHRADRYWGLYDTRQIVDSFEAMSMTTDRIRQAAKFEEMQKAREMVTALRTQGVEKITPAEFASYMAGTYNIAVGATESGKLLTALGVPLKRTKESRWYQLSEDAVSVE